MKMDDAYLYFMLILLAMVTFFAVNLHVEKKHHDLQMEALEGKKCK